MDTDVGLYWFENDGSGRFTKHVIHERAGEMHGRHETADINGDRRPEIVSVDNKGGSLSGTREKASTRKAGLVGAGVQIAFHWRCGSRSGRLRPPMDHERSTARSRSAMMHSSPSSMV